MSTLFPIIQPKTTDAPTGLPLYKEVAWDFDRGKPIFKQGEPAVVTGVGAVKVWAWKALLTQRTRYPIYSWDYGNELETLIGQNYSDRLKRAEAVRYVREALEGNPYITRVSNISVSFTGGKMTIAATMETVYGEVDIHV